MVSSGDRYCVRLDIKLTRVRLIPRYPAVVIYSIEHFKIIVYVETLL